MSDIKSAHEIAMEKVDSIGEATEEERLAWKYLPRGEELAGRYLKDGCNLIAELGDYPEAARPYVVRGAVEILIRYIDVPRNDAAKKDNKKAMDGIKILKSDKVTVENVFSRIRNIFSHYAEQGDQQRQQAYQSLKQEFEARVEQARQQQLGTFMGMKIDVEKQPQFHQEWRKILTQLDSQYITLLNELKKEVSDIA